MTDERDQADDAARRAGWNPADGRPPYRHTMPPPVDPDLGHNGIAPTDAEQTA